MASIAANHYETLRLPRDADRQAVKRAYFSLVKHHTPDGDPEGFRALREAYETLGDDKKRTGYDALFSAPERLQNALIAARELINRTKLKQALKDLTALYAENPGETDVALTLALAYHKNGNNGKAQSLCEKILGDDPGSQQALHLLARASAARGHTMKASEFYTSAIALAPENPKPWADYLRFVFDDAPYLASQKMREACAVSEDMFKDDYVLYLQAASVCTRWDERDDTEKYAGKFADFFLADRRPEPNIYNAAVKFFEHFAGDGYAFPFMDRLLHALLESGHRQPHHEQALKNIADEIGLRKLRDDSRTGDLLCDLTRVLHDACDCPECTEERLVLESNLVMRADTARKRIEALKAYYPSFFDLNRKLYEDLLNPGKEKFLQEKYESIGAFVQEAKRRHGALTENDIERLEKLNASDEAFFMEKYTPRVRETPKIGRNAPCPCGSGKKYKRCCGINA